jgi:hypothetical protein
LTRKAQLNERGEVAVSKSKVHIVSSSFISGSGVEIVICTVHGEVLEFTGCQIIGVCEISACDPKSITIFTTYDLKCNIFYIVECGNGILILSREGGLKVWDVVLNFSLYWTLLCYSD